MEPISLSGPVDPFDVYRKIVDRYYEPVEEVIRTRLHHLLTEPRDSDKVEKAIDEILALSVERLRELIPGARIFWDDHVDMPHAFDTYPCVVVDVVDGARNLHEGGTDATSTLAIVDYRKNIPLAVVSYPFGVERVVDLDAEVYRIPNAIMRRQAVLTRDHLREYRLEPGKLKGKRSLSDIRFAERYDVFDAGDPFRKGIDHVRGALRSYLRQSGAISKMMMSVALGSCDVFLTKRQEPIDFYDYLAPSKIIRDLGGCVTDLQGNNLPADALHAEGLIVASSRQTLATFLGAIEAAR